MAEKEIEMKTYDSSHWVTDTVVDGKTNFEVMGAIASDLSEAKLVISELAAWYLVEGTGTDKNEAVQEILQAVFDTPLDDSDKARYIKAQVQSSYVIAMAANDLVTFMSEAVNVMLANIDEHGFGDE